MLDDTDEENLDEAIMTYYRNQRSEVLNHIRIDTNNYLVDEDSKELMRQALSAHENALYRLEVWPGTPILPKPSFS